MKNIIVDLDVVTVASYPRKKSDVDYGRTAYAQRFLKHVAAGIRNGEFWLVALRNFDALLALWKHKKMVMEILDFFHSNGSEFIDNAELIAEFVEKGLDYDALVKSFTGRGIKGEDVLIILVASLRGAAIVTFNKKDLRGRSEEINRLLAASGLAAVEIMEPREFWPEGEQEGSDANA